MVLVTISCFRIQELQIVVRYVWGCVAQDCLGLGDDGAASAAGCQCSAGAALGVGAWLWR